MEHICEMCGLSFKEGHIIQNKEAGEDKKFCLLCFLKQFTLKEPDGQEDQESKACP